MITKSKYALILFIGFLGFSFSLSNPTNNPTGTSITDAITVDLGTSSTITIFGTNSSNGGSATGMQGSCNTISCCSVLVYKVILPYDGLLRVDMANFTQLAGSMIAYYSPSGNPTTWSDLAYIQSTPGNFCGFRDSLQLGWGYNFYTNTYDQTYNSTYDFNNPSGTAGFFPGGTYYILFFNENQQANISGGNSDLTFQFIPGCQAGEPEINVEGNSTAIADGDNTPSTSDDTDFGTAVVNSAAISKTFTIDNTGVSDLNISAVNVIGDNNFAVTTSPASIVTNGNTTSLTVTYTPSNIVGESTATVEILSDDCDNPNFRFDLKVDVTCETAAEIEVSSNNTIITDGDNTPTSLDNTDFGTTIPTSPVSKTFTVSNLGTSQLDVSMVTITGTNAADFSVTTSPMTALGGSNNTTFTIEYTPSGVGNSEATVEITNTDCDETIYEFDIKGFGIASFPSYVRGNRIEFDGTNDFINIDNVATAMDGSTEFTVEGWINADATQSGNNVIVSCNTSSGGNVFIFQVQNGILRVYDGSDGDNYGTDLRGTGWHHVALTHNNSRDTVYLDGVALGSSGASISTFNSTHQWSIGQEYDGSSKSDYFLGQMEEIRIWNDVRTAAEIRAYMHRTLTEAEIEENAANLKAYYQFDNDDAAGTVDGVKDIMGNHGTSTGGTYAASEVSVGAGTFSSIEVTTAGNKNFTDTDCEINFLSTVPNDYVSVTKIFSEKPVNLPVDVMTEQNSEYWVIENDGTNTGLGATVKLKFTSTQVVSTNTADYKVHKRGANETEASDWTAVASPTITTDGNGSYIEFIVDDFSQFYVSYNTTVLPVEMTSFKGELTEEKIILLSWQTASEENNEGFEVERSTNGETWENIGYVLGAGTTQEIQNYSFTDMQPIEGINYYRLKQMDFGGYFSYSDIVSVKLKTVRATIRIYPNPVHNNLTIEDVQGIATIHNLLGQPVKEFSINNEQENIDLSDLTEGQYLLMIQAENGERVIQQFVKQ